MEAKYIDHMGDDIRVVNSARVSFKKESNWEKEELDHSTDFSLSEGDKKLITYLATHGHWTPFAHVQITLREKVPIFVARQRFKHMVGFTYNEVSRRYVDDAPEFYTPVTWRGRAENKKQGSSNQVITTLVNEVKDFDGDVYETVHNPIDKWYKNYIEQISWFYQNLIDNGVAPEQARMVLPQSMYTEYYVTGSLAAWARAYSQRSDPHAQREIQELAAMWDKEIRTIKGLENSWNALVL